MLFNRKSIISRVTLPYFRVQKGTGPNNGTEYINGEFGMYRDAVTESAWSIPPTHTIYKHIQTLHAIAKEVARRGNFACGQLRGGGDKGIWTLSLVRETFYAVPS